MLYLLSLGLSDEKDMSLKALETAKRCTRLYAEFYTLKMNTDAGKLSELVGKPVKELERSGMEEGFEKIVEEARKQDVGVFVGGDALSATTHISLVMDARKAGVKVEIIHGASIFSAVAETGLQLYKFGRTVTLTREKPESVFRGIMSNMDAGLHTLVLLDVDMPGNEGCRLLLEGGITGNAVVACRLGSDSLIRYGSLEKLQNDPELGKVPSVVCLPGRLHFLEKEYLESLDTGTNS